MNKLFVALAVAFALIGCASHGPDRGQAKGEFGLLVMAHGGGKTWNGEVETMLAPLRRDYPLEIAFGMADAKTIEQGVHALEARGVRKIGVVRLFISGDSWYERTEQILGLAPGASAKPAHDQAAHYASADHAAHGQHGGGHGHAGAHAAPGAAAGHGGHSMGFWQIDSEAAFALSKEGLADAPEMGAVLAKRAQTLSQDPRRESVLILAHGPESDAENARWLKTIDARADAIRKAVPFRRVQVETLREDWPAKRKAAEARIRGFVKKAARRGGRTIVIPYRIQGFGPYAKVLDGLTYASDGHGLIPSAEVEQWVRRQAETLRARAFRTPAKTMAQVEHGQPAATGR